MNVGSLFSGIGGIELGFEREGFKTSWFVENNPYCQEVLKKNFPGVPIYGDITTLDFSTLPKVDIITGGFPCQDISVAGKQKGIKEGKRSSLWTYYKEAIRILRPRFALIENVPNLLNIGLNVVLADLASIGYDAEWFCLAARQFGALHRRERIFIVAYPNTHERLWTQIPNQTGKQTQHGSNGCSSSNINCNGFNSSNNSSKGMDFEKRKIEEGKSFGKGWIDEPSAGSSLFITDDWGERIQRFRQESLQGQQGFSWCKDIRSLEDIKGRPDIPEPLVRGNAYGISNRVERTRALGNAVVPQVAQFIARRIKEVLNNM